MITTIDGAGRVVVPNEVRRQAKLGPGTRVEIRCRNGVVEIEPAPLPITLRRRGRLLVAVPERDVPPLTSTAVEETRRRLRRDRGAEQTLPGILPDTSVLIAAFCAWHEHHAPAAEAIEAAARQRRAFLLAGPVLVETYAVLTRLPPPHRLSPDSVRRLLESNLAGVRTVALDGRGYWAFVRRATADGVAGGRSYDALVVACAVRAGADRLLTLNRRDFETLVPTGITVECPADAR